MNPEPISQETFRGARDLALLLTPEKAVTLARMLPTLENIVCLKRGGDVTITGMTVNGRATLREADPLAMATTIANSGARAAKIYEGNIIVSVVKAGATKPLPHRGRFKLEAEGIGGATYLTAITNRRGACGDIAAFVANDNEPVGSFLL